MSASVNRPIAEANPYRCRLAEHLRHLRQETCHVWLFRLQPLKGSAFLVGCEILHGSDFGNRIGQWSSPRERIASSRTWNGYTFTR